MADLTNIESKLFSAREFRLESGQTLPVLELAYETYGTLSPAKDNAVLVVHGYTSSHHAAAKNASGKEGRGVTPGAAGWFDGLIGPGKAIDTDKHFVISVNALGSAHGSSGPNAIDPRTKKPYGPTFPEITLRDMVASQKLLVDSFGLKGLVAVVGPSMGGFQSFQWAASFPGFMKGIAASVTAPRAPGRLGGLEALQKRLAGDPNWNGGWYYENGGIPGVLEQIRYETLLNYGAKEADAKVAAKSWAKIYDGHSLVTLRRAIDGFDITNQYDKLKQTKVLYVISKTDKLFDITDCAAHALAMRKAGVDLTYVEMPSDKGHMASHQDAAMWSPILAAFMQSLR
ncbi:MAG TPA: alpha/beta fold hydrolase [Reyranella sp.]|nr:alpha/beta fold hydrolase [Reyranella sp.]